MGLSGLRKILEAKVCDENISVTIPNIFLPPRFRKISNGRDMILFMDRDVTLHVRWEGVTMPAHQPLTKRATNRLIQDVLRTMAKYRSDLYIYSRFMERWADDPMPSERYDETLYEGIPPPAKEKPETTSPEIVAKLSAKDPKRFVGGGESPMPTWDWEHGE